LSWLPLCASAFFWYGGRVDTHGILCSPPFFFSKCGTFRDIELPWPSCNEADPIVVSTVLAHPTRFFLEDRGRDRQCRRSRLAANALSTSRGLSRPFSSLIRRFFFFFRWPSPLSSLPVRYIPTYITYQHLGCTTRGRAALGRYRSSFVFGDPGRGSCAARSDAIF